MSATITAAETHLEALAVVQALAELVDELQTDGTILGLDLRYVHPLASIVGDSMLWPALSEAYGYLPDSDSLDDDEYDKALVEQERPHEDRVGRWRKQLRKSLEHNEALARANRGGRDA